MSFRLKTILGIAAIEILLLSALVISGLHYLRESNGNQLMDRANNSARLIATMTADAVVAMDLATLDSLVEQALLNRGLIYVRVRNSGGTVLSEGGDAKALALPFEADEDIEATYLDQRIDVTQSISIAGKTFGHVEMGIDTRAIGAALSGARQWMLSVAGIEVLLVALFSYILGSALTRQLRHIQVGARQVAKGNFGFQINARGRDELADTANSFNAMSSALAVYSSELEDARAKAEAGQAHAESILEDAIKSLSQGVLIVDQENRILHMNGAFAGLYASARDRVAQATHLNELRAITKPLISAQQVHGGDDDTVFDRQRTLTLDDGRQILHTRRNTASGGAVFVGTDVTLIYQAQERARQLELELMHAQKLESLGTLAGGIAHEINTPIQYIGDNLRFLEQSFDDLSEVIKAHEKLIEFVDTGNAGSSPEISATVEFCRALLLEKDLEFLIDEVPLAARQSSDGVRQVADIVRAMKEFSHPTSKELAPVDLNRVVERATMVCRSEWKHVAELDLNLQDGMPMVLGLEGELNQVVLNLVVNAAHAIADTAQGSGRIAIATKIEDGAAIMSVTDTGTGIPEEIRGRIFDPFFTTKDVGKGTGQGLAITRDVIVNKHNGALQCDSAVGEGTTFRVHLPLHETMATPEPAHTA